MCWKLYFNIIIYVLRVVSTSSLEISSLCGVPGSLYGSSIYPIKEKYIEGDEVDFRCKDELIDIVLTRKKCEKGLWIGPESSCGMKEHLDKLDYISITNKYDKNISGPNLVFTDEENFGNHFFIHDLKNSYVANEVDTYNVTLKMNSVTVYLLRMAIFNNKESYVNDPYVTLNVGDHQKCEQIKVGKLLKFEWSKVKLNGTQESVYWFMCKAINEKETPTTFTHLTSLKPYTTTTLQPYLELSEHLPSLEPSTTINALIKSKKKLSLNAIDFYIIQQNKGCGTPIHSFGYYITRVGSGQYFLNCTKGFIQTDRNDKREIICNANLEWQMPHIECAPEKFCNVSKEGKKNLKDIVSLKNVYYQNTTYWYAINGSEALITCENKKKSTIYNKTVVCTPDGKWNELCSDDEKEVTTKLTTEPDYTNKTDAGETTITTQNIRHSTNRLKCIHKGEYMGISNWPEVEAGVYSIVSCPQGGGGQVVWKCMDNGKFTESGPDWTNCYKWLDDMSNETEFNENAINNLEIISNHTTGDNSIVDFDRSVQLMERIQGLQEFANKVLNNDSVKVKKVATKTVNILSNLVNQKFMWANSTSHQKTDLASNILKSIQYSSFYYGSKQISSNETEELKSENVYINTFNNHPRKKFVFPKDENIKNASITIPEGLESINFIEMNTNETNTSAGAVIDKLSDYLLGGISETNKVFSPILLFSLTYNIRTVKLNKPIKIKFRNRRKLRFGQVSKCVFWDFNTSLWSSEGCSKVDHESDLFTTVCECNHLTNFAALMDTSGRETNDNIKSKLTYICCGISIACLMFTIILIIDSSRSSKFSDTNNCEKDLKSVVECNLSVSLIIVNLLILSAMDNTDNKLLCQISSGVLLYALLSSFFWMLLEGYYLYRTLTLELNNEYNFLYLYGFGYGMPIIIFVIGLSSFWFTENVFMDVFFDERYNHFCWISSTRYSYHIWLLIGPVIFVILVNGILIIVSLYNEYFGSNAAKRNVKKIQMKKKRVFSFICLFSIMGITWLSFILYVHHIYNLFSYLFIVLNGTQGFFILLYHHYMNKKMD